MNKFDIEFINCSYDKIIGKVKENDFIYLDPPYYNTKSSMYFGQFDFDEFFDNLKKINNKGVKYLMSFDGKSGNVDNTCSVVPEECYEQHLYIKSGNSSFKRVTGMIRNSMVYESLYMNFHNEYNGLF